MSISAQRSLTAKQWIRTSRLCFDIRKIAVIARGGNDVVESSDLFKAKEMLRGTQTH
jgi:hypothetical protein